MTLCLLFNHHRGGSVVDTHDFAPGGDGRKRKRFTGHPVLWEQTAVEIKEVIEEVEKTLETPPNYLLDNTAAREIVENRLMTLTAEFQIAKKRAEVLRYQQILDQLIQLKKLAMEMADEEALLLILANLD